MTTRINLTNWEVGGDLVRLYYDDGDSFSVRKEDFNRAFGSIVNADKSAIKRDFTWQK